MHPIFDAILQNDLPAFLGLVEARESSLEERSEEQNTNNTVLHVAAKLGHRELVAKIIELRPSLLSSRNAYGDTPLHLAALLGDVNIVMQMLDTGLELYSARNNKNQTPLHLAFVSIFMEAAKFIVEKTNSVDLDELNFALSSGSTCIVGIILERFPELARKNAWEVEDGSRSTLLHYACDKGDLELTSILLGLNQGLEEALNSKGLSPLHLAVQRGSVIILEEFMDKSPLSFCVRTPSKETVFHLAARNKNTDAFVFMAENLGTSSPILLKKKDQQGNTVLHIAASVSCGSPLIRYIVGKKIIDIRDRNNMGYRAYHLLPRQAQDYEFISSYLRCDTKTSEEVDSKKAERNEPHIGHSEVIRLLKLIEISTSEIAERKKSKKHHVKRGHKSLEHEMHIEALQNARNTIAIVAVLIASVSYAGGINPPGGVYQDGPWKGKSLVGNTAAFKVFAICNNIALFTSLCIVILLVSIIPYQRKPLKKLLVATHRMMWVSVGFMATAYVAASLVTIPHFPGTRWLFPVIISVAGGSLTVLFSYLGVETISHWFKKMNRVGRGLPIYFIKNNRVEDIPAIAKNEGEMPSLARTNSDLAASEGSGYFTY
ncbi:Ankyrin repeat family protein [Arabidopsis thaliana]|jgi:ankyrin repeat protein|uniref:Ankyrin repeat family protein n=1 Tax=Arabidopsis thaliana TaxID=3702 RepID=F4IPR3_ARATH|nr:Ankyrin repeat family protein [Arabidopsis thaliana]NP_973528.1 Ankyrin repeat family protein [Arabidopsis thaliana]AEC07597.1 Ankyrin repeat family protein [Arabidopsis thaliana]AEC07600.1 Ankyrin repeat family protein [Arabidopsis thaliana]|eukprot:NP_001189592.1 Ankyrin repeat family protein [Arabidopsis thaliana]